MNNDFFETSGHFVCIPSDEIEIKDMNECIDFVVYIKYKMISKEIILNQKHKIN
jgi:hypothetical protein